MGGYAAATVLLVCFIAIGLPAAMVRDNFNTIDAIDEKMELARNYVTALLRGDDKELDRYEYQANADNFKPHSTELTHPQYTGMQVFYVTSRYDQTNYYLRGWIGSKYENGAWYAADENAVNYYYRLFGKEASPSEDLKYEFFHYMKPDLVDSTDYTENIFSRYQLNREYGFVNVLVGLRRVNSPSTLTYFPSTFDPRYGVFEGYGKDVESPVSFVNYYDGLYTGRKFHESGLSYSTYTYAPIMTDPEWILNVGALEAAYSLQKEVLLANTGFYVNPNNGKVTSYLKLDVTEDVATGNSVFTYTYKRDTTTKVWRFAHESFEKKDGQYIVTTPAGTMTLTLKGREVVGATYVPVRGEDGPIYTDLVEAHDYKMTVEDGKTLMEYLEREQTYGDFVYQMYLGKSDSQEIRELAEIILSQAHKEEIRTYDEVIPDDPETPEDDSFTVTHKETVNVPVDKADILQAALRNSSDPHAYEMRDLLVRNVIDYIIDEIILKALPAPREEVSEFAPKMKSMKIPVDKIREVIGSGGKVIQKIVADTGAKIDINDDGTIFIAAVDKASAEMAKSIIDAIVFEPVVGETYDGIVTRIIPIGAFVEYAPGKEGMVHISKLQNKRTEKVEDAVSVGDQVRVKYLGTDEKGRQNLSMKDADPKAE